MEKYLLVLQYPMNEEHNYEYVLTLEKQIIQTCPSSLKLDGHDIGNGEINIFFYTNNPSKAFMELKEKSNEVLKKAKVAYRDINGETYTILYPRGETRFIIT